MIIRLEDYEVTNEVMIDALAGKVFRNKKSDEVYVFESLFPSQEGMYFNLRGRNIRTEKPVQYIFNEREFKELEIVEPDSELGRIAGEI